MLLLGRKPQLSPREKLLSHLELFTHHKFFNFPVLDQEHFLKAWELMLLLIFQELAKTFKINQLLPLPITVSIGICLGNLAGICNNIFSIVTNNLFPNGGSLDDNSTYDAEQRAIYDASHTGAYTIVRTTGNQAVALPLQDATSDYETIIAYAKAQDPAAIYPNGTDATVLAGYAAQREELYSLYASKDTPVGNIFWNTGPSTSIYFLKPFSRGAITISSIDPLVAPTVDFRSNSDDTDLEIQTALFLKNRELMSQPSMQVLGPIETSPAPGINETAALKSALAGSLAPSNAHLCCTSAMMKLEYGGVVASDLTVYGTTRLSVVDNSIFPMPAGAAPSAVIYAAAEKVC